MDAAQESAARSHVFAWVADRDARRGGWLSREDLLTGCTTAAGDPLVLVDQHRGARPHGLGARRYARAVLRERVGRSVFRTRVVRAHGTRCAICDLAGTALLTAAPVYRGTHPHDERLGVLAEARRPVVTHHPAPGRQEQDAEVLLRDAAACVAEVLAGRDAAAVAGLGIDHQGESVVAWDAVDGHPLAPVVVWPDRRGAPVLDRLGAGAVARSGLPADPYFSASKMTWLLGHVPAVSAAARRGRLRLGTLDAFLVERLGGPFRTDLSSASRTQLLALGGRDWDPALLDAFGLDAAWLPRVGATWGEHGTLRHPSLPCPLPLRAQVVDQQAALAGSGCVRPGAVKATYGTGVFVLADTGTTVPSGSTGLLPTVAWSDGSEVTCALDGGVFTAGSLMEWLCTLGLAPDPEALCALAAEEGSSAGVRVLPSLAGLGAPWWRPQARGVLAAMLAAVGAGVLEDLGAGAALLAHRVALVGRGRLGAAGRLTAPRARRSPDRTGSGCRAGGQAPDPGGIDRSVTP